MTLWQRIKAWAVGPGGWLADSDLDEYLAAVDQELDAKERIERWCAYWDAMIDDEEAIQDTEETAMTLRQKIRQTLIDFNEFRLDLEEAVDLLAEYVEERTTELILLAQDTEETA